MTENNVVTIEPPRRKSVTMDMADRFGMDHTAFERTLRATVFPANAPAEEFAAFLLVAKEYHLNPITKEIYAFPKRGGGIVPVVSIDGWMNLINSNPHFDGMEFEEKTNDDDELVAIKCTIYRKDRAHPVAVTEYLSECIRPTDPWKMKHRMLRHKAAIQCARYAFAFAGIYDEDEAEKIAEARAEARLTPPRLPVPPRPPAIEHKPAVTADNAPAEAPALVTPPRPPRPPQTVSASVNVVEASAPAHIDDGALVREWTDAAECVRDLETLDEAFSEIVTPVMQQIGRTTLEVCDRIYNQHRARVAA